MHCTDQLPVSVSVYVQDVIVALVRARVHSITSVRGFPKLVLIVTLVRLNTIILSSEGGVLASSFLFPSGDQCCVLPKFRKFSKPQSISALPSCRPDMMSFVLMLGT